MDFHAVAGQRIGNHLRRVTLFFRQKQRRAMKDQGARAKPREGLRQPAAERTAADNQQTGRLHLQVEHGFAAQEARLGQALDFRPYRA